MEQPSKEEIQAYYDAHIAGKLHGYVNRNDRVEAAYAEVKKLITPDVRNVIEIGCGIGDISYRIAKQFPKVSVKGVDISEKSIRAAKLLFKRENLSYHCGEIDVIDGFVAADLIVLMDVYEHIENASRNDFNKMLDKLLAKNGKILLTFPTPQYQAWLRAYDPGGLQPVDEDITVATIADLARTADCEVQFFKRRSVYHPNDYAHALLERSMAWGRLRPTLTAFERLKRKYHRNAHRVTSYFRKREIKTKLNELMERSSPP